MAFGFEEGAGTMKKIIQILEFDDSLWGLSNEGKIYQLVSIPQGIFWENLDVKFGDDE